MTNLSDARLTVPEAAFVAGVSSKAINREIDAKVITGTGAERKLGVADLFYLVAIRDVRDQVGPSLRKSFRRVISEAAASGEPEARCHHFVFAMKELRAELLSGFEQLERTTDEFVEERPEVLHGEPVLKGTRIAVRHIADLVKHGASSDEIEEDYEISAEQVQAALIYDRTRPRRGRPLARRNRTTHVPATR